MKYYLCIVGNFPEAEEIFEHCLQNGFYQYYDGTRQKGVVGEIKKGAKLILVYHKELRAFATAGDCSKKICGWDKHWIGLPTAKGWECALKEMGPRLPYGVYEHTLEGKGTKQSIVKEIDSLWATELIQMIKRAAAHDVNDVSFPIQLEELAVGLSSSNRYFSIPAVQRGLVWNSARCEYLWDSIMRGIPIGAISVRRNRSNQSWEIFDGQQRANTIGFGFESFPPQKTAPILWIDLQPEPTTMNSGNDDENCREFGFYITTAAHPWGYTASTSETKTSYMSVISQKDAVADLESLGGRWSNHGKKGARPYPFEMWPHCASFPVPFSILREYVEQADVEEPQFDNFINYCRRWYGKYNWMLNVEKRIQINGLSAPARWKMIVNAILKLSNYTVVALNCIGIDDKDIGLYFRRMNKSGMVPDAEEINYSLVKSKIEGVKCLDDYRHRRTSPARLAHVAMRYWLSRKADWKLSDVDLQEIIRNKDAFEVFVRREGEFEKLVDKLDVALIKPKDNQDDGLLPLHVQQVFNVGDGELAVLLLRYCETKAIEEWSFRALATLIMWFSENASVSVRKIWQTSSLQEGISRAMMDNNGIARIPDPEEIGEFVRQFEQVIEQDTKSAWENAMEIRKNSPYCSDAIDKIWNGFHDGDGCSLLLYSCRRFIRDWFNGYDTCAPEWGEQNRPWDYDHIAPQDWFGGNQMSSDWRLPLCKVLRDSIGNSAPIPFSLNRGKKATPPGKYYPTGDKSDVKSLFIDAEGISRYEQPASGKLHREKGRAVQFARTTIERFTKLYCEWYDGCRVVELLDYSRCLDERRKTIEKFSELFCKRVGASELGCYFVREPFQHLIVRDWDWMRSWISCGMTGAVSFEGKKVRCLIGIAVGEGTWEWGIRRHPNEADMSSRDVWWLNDETYGSCENDLDLEKCINDLVSWMREYKFVRQNTTA